MGIVNKIYYYRSIVILFGITMLFSCENKISEIELGAGALEGGRG